MVQFDKEIRLSNIGSDIIIPSRRRTGRPQASAIRGKSR